MSELTDKLRVLNDPSINLIVDEYEDVVSKFETAKAVIDAQLSDDDVSSDILDVSLKLVKCEQIRFKTLQKVVNKLYNNNSLKIEIVIRDNDLKIVNKLRKKYEEPDTDELEAVSDKSHGSEAEK